MEKCRRLELLVLAVVFVLVLEGCSATPPQVESSIAIAQTAPLQQNEAQGLTENVAVVSISGGFVASVEDIPEKEYNGKVVVLNTFQGVPFILHMSRFGQNITNEGSEVFSVLEEGKSYYFEIEKQEMVTLPKAELALYESDPQLALLSNSLRITIAAVREPTEEEYGPGSWEILFEEA